MKRYKEEMDHIHMSDELKQKIRNQAFTSASKKQWYTSRIILIPISCLVLVMITISLLLNQTPSSNSPNSEHNKLILADDGKRTYTPISDGLIGSMGVNTMNDRGNTLYDINTLPIYKVRYTRDKASFSFKNEQMNEINNWKYPYEERLKLNKGLQASFNSSTMISNTGGLIIQLSGKESYASNHINETILSTIKTKLEPLLSYHKPVWENNKNEYIVYESAKSKKAKFLNKSIKSAEINIKYLPSLNVEGQYNLEIIIFIKNPNFYELLGDVTIINEKTARDLLKRGGFYYQQSILDETLQANITDEQIKRVELMYKVPASEENALYPYIVPIYQYQVAISKNDTRYLEVVAIPQKQLKKYQETIWYFQ